MTDKAEAAGLDGILDSSLRGLFGGWFLSILSAIQFWYQILFSISRAEFVNSGLLQNIFNRIELVIGIFMLFKLTISVIQGIIDPDKFSDSKKGFSNIIMRTFIALFMFALLVPISIPDDVVTNSYEEKVRDNGILFGILFSLQDRLLNNNVLGKMVLGNDYGFSETFEKEIRKEQITKIKEDIDTVNKVVDVDIELTRTQKNEIIAELNTIKNNIDKSKTLEIKLSTTTKSALKDLRQRALKKMDSDNDDEVVDSILNETTSAFSTVINSSDYRQEALMNNAGRSIAVMLAKSFVRVNLKPEKTRTINNPSNSDDETDSKNWMCGGKELSGAFSDISPENLYKFYRDSTDFFDILSITQAYCVVKDNGVLEFDTDRYMFSYMGIASVLASLVFAFVLFCFCFDVATRQIKLIVLKLIAPIPIIAYISPNSDNGSFNAWVKTLTATYLDLFMRLLVLYLIIFITSGISSGGLLDASGPYSSFAIIIIWISAFLFLRKAPKFFKQALGIKDDGKNGIFSGIASIAKGVAGGTAGAVGSSIASSRASYLRDTVNERDHTTGRLFKNFGAGLLGGITGAVSGAQTAATAKDHWMKNTINAVSKNNVTRMQDAAHGVGSFSGITGAERFFVGETAGDKLQREWEKEEDKIKYQKQRNQYRKQAKDRADSKALESDKTSGFVSYNGHKKYNFNANFSKLSSVIEAAKNQALREADYEGQKIDMRDAEIVLRLAKEANQKDYYHMAMTQAKDANGRIIINDTVINQARDKFNDMTQYDAPNAHITLEVNYDNNKINFGELNNAIESSEVKLANARNDSANARAVYRSKRGK